MPKKQSKKSAAKVAVTISKSTKKAIKVAAGAAAGLAAAGAAAYMLTGKQGKKTKAVVSKTAKMIERGVKKQSAAVKKVARKAYTKGVDAITAGAGRLAEIDAKDVMEFTGDIKKRWERIAREVQTAAKQVKQIIPPVKRAVTKTIKKTATKKRR